MAWWQDILGIKTRATQSTVISYNGGVKDTTDLEPGTATIVPITRPAIAAAQYTSVQTLSTPSDARLAILRLVHRLNVNIFAMGTAGHLYCSVRVDVDDANHEVFNENWTTNGNKLDAVDVHSGFLPAVLALLTDGNPHTFYFLFWADQANQVQITVVQLWFGLGSCFLTANCTYGAAIPYCAQLTYQGSTTTHVIGATPGGNATVAYSLNTYSGRATTGAGQPSSTFNLTVTNNPYLDITGTVATDYNILKSIYAVIAGT
jgi:hypothetical protein